MVKLQALKDDRALVLQLEFDNINVEMDAKVIVSMLTLCWNLYYLIAGT